MTPFTRFGYLHKVETKITLENKICVTLDNLVWIDNNEVKINILVAVLPCVCLFKKLSHWNKKNKMKRNWEWISFHAMVITKIIYISNFQMEVTNLSQFVWKLILNFYFCSVECFLGDLCCAFKSLWSYTCCNQTKKWKNEVPWISWCPRCYTCGLQWAMNDFLYFSLYL